MSDNVVLVVVETPELAATEAARLLADAARAGGEIVLAGGSTPRRAYELAAAREPNWGGARVWLGDERVVDDDALSNAALVRTALLDRLDTPPRFEPVATELGAEAAAAAYDHALRGVALDLALLGLGADGHTASLFPGSPALAVRDRLVVAADAGLEPWVDRVTLTVPAFEAAAHVVFLAVGEEKATAVWQAFDEPLSPDTPASLVRGRRTTAILDTAAARFVRLDRG